MKTNNSLSSEDQKLLEEFRKKYALSMKERPFMSDEEFMAKTEVSDEEYAIGLILPGIADADS
jgi:hypothetical protein